MAAAKTISRVTVARFIPKTVLALRGSDGVAEEGAKEGAMVGLWIRSWTHSLIFAAIYGTW